MHCNVYPIFVKIVRLTHSNKELLTYLLTVAHSQITINDR